MLGSKRDYARENPKIFFTGLFLMLNKGFLFGQTLLANSIVNKPCNL